MKISREKNIIKIEIEQSDCEEGQDPEMVADLFMAGFQFGNEHKQLVSEIGEEILTSHPQLKEGYANEKRDYKDRWELGQHDS